MLKADPAAAARRLWRVHPGRRGLSRFPHVAAIAVLLTVLSAGVGLAAQHARVSSPDGLNLRDAPSLSGNVVTVLPFGAGVDELATPTADGWVNVSAQGQQGFVRSLYLDLTPAQPLHGVAIVAPADGVRLRLTPSLSGQIISVLPPGTQVQIFGDSTADGWYSVNAAGSSGWVSGDYLTALPPDGQAARITWYGHDFDGGVLACGGVFTADDPGTAATNGYPCGTHLKVCAGSKCVTVAVRDRGHLPPGAIDLSAAAFQRLATLDTGTLTGTISVTTDPVAAPGQ